MKKDNKKIAISLGQTLASNKDIILEGQKLNAYIITHVTGEDTARYFIQDDDGNDHEIVNTMNNWFIFKDNKNDKSN